MPVRGRAIGFIMYIRLVPILLPHLSVVQVLLSPTFRSLQLPTAASSDLYRLAVKNHPPANNPRSTLNGCEANGWSPHFSPTTHTDPWALGTPRIGPSGNRRPRPSEQSAGRPIRFVPTSMGCVKSTSGAIAFAFVSPRALERVTLVISGFTDAWNTA